MVEVTLRQLEYFLAVAEEESLARAAERCSVTPAAISLALKELEAALGSQLVIRRHSKGVFLNSQGVRVAARGRNILLEASRLTEAVTEGLVRPRTIKIGCFSALSPHVVPEIAEFFQEWQSDTQLHIEEGSGAELQEKMLRGGLDLCILYEPQLSPDVTAAVLQRNEYKIALSPEHPLAGNESISLVDLEHYPAATLSQTPGVHITDAFFRQYSVVPNVKYYSQNVETIRSLVGRNLAYSLLIQEVPRSIDGLPIIYKEIIERLRGNAIMAAVPRGVPASDLLTGVFQRLKRVLSHS